MPYDAAVIGSGPNGLAAAITLARAGRSVLLIEGAARAGGGLRSEALTLPGFTHDVCSSIHALGAASPFFRSLPLQQHGLEWITPSAALAHPLDDGTAVLLEPSIGATAEPLGEDGPAYRKLMEPLTGRWDALAEEILSPPHLPRHPILLARFGLLAVQPAVTFARGAFRGARARALFAGLAAHSILPLERPASAAFGLVLGALGHLTGWPVARGGSGALAGALAAVFRAHGGQIVTGQSLASLDELPKTRHILCDVTPRQLITLTGERLHAGYRGRLQRYRYGPGVFKVDWALSRPIPWKAPACLRAATVHVGGTLEEIAAAEAAAWRGTLVERPFVLLTQPSLFDPSRAPEGRHTAWAYCHVPHGSGADMTEAIEAQVERFAPGFRDVILARHTRSAPQLERYNPNCVGGDINGGVQDLGQLITRPVARWVPYATPLRGVYLCSSSTPPGGGVHGMCGYHAASAALREGS